MNKTYDAKYYGALEDFWPPIVARGTASSKTKCAWPSMPAPLTLSSNRLSRHRRPHYNYSHRHQDQYHANASFAQDFRTYQYLQRQFSEDSGFSSCGSSASSVADDLETFSGPVSCGSVMSGTSGWSKSSCSWKNSSSRSCRLQSGTVASVLAAGVSDSEETDCESDDEASDGVFSTLAVAGENNTRESTVLSSKPFRTSGAKQFIQNDNNRKDAVQLKHCGRNILDLGTNLTTQFPFKAAELPEKNLPLFLLNRSQYHRLGKFGAIENLCFANCSKQCGFAFPIPPKDDINCEKKT